MAKVFMTKVESEMTVSGKSNESIDSMLRRFKRKVLAEGILNEVRQRQYFMSKSQKRKEKSKRAQIRERKEQKQKY